MTTTNKLREGVEGTLEHLMNAYSCCEFNCDDTKKQHAEQWAEYLQHTLNEVVQESCDEILRVAIDTIKAPKHCGVHECVRCEEQQRAINILESLTHKSQ